MEHNLPPKVLGFRPGRQAADLLFVIHSVIAKSTATGENLYIVKMDISKAFDSSGLDLIEEAGRHYTTTGLAQALVQEQREGQLELQIPGSKERRCVVKRKGVYQGQPTALHMAHGKPCVEALVVESN